MFPGRAGAAQRPCGAVRVLLHHVANADAAGHAKLEPVEGVPREHGPQRRDVRGAEGPEGPGPVAGRPRPRDRRPAAGGRHAVVEGDRREQRAVRRGRVCGLVERPEPEAGTVHAAADRQRTGPHRRAVGVRVLVLGVADGSGGFRGRSAHVLVRRQDGAVQRCVQLRRRRHSRKHVSPLYFFGTRVDYFRVTGYKVLTGV